MKQYQDRSYRRFILLDGEDFSLLSSQYTLSAIVCQVFRIPAEPFTPRFLKPPTEILPRIGMGTHIRPIHLALGDGCWQIVRPRSLGSCTLQAFPIALPQYLVAFCSLRYERLETDFVPCVLSIQYLSALSRENLKKFCGEYDPIPST